MSADAETDPRVLRVAARYYDGRHARGHPVTLALQDQHVVVAGDVSRIAAIESLDISDELGTAPRFVRFPDGAVCEVGESAALDRLLAHAGVRRGFIARWCARSWCVLGALLLAGGLAIGGYRYGAPIGAAAIARTLPPAAVHLLSDRVLQTLDRGMLRPSRVPKDTRARIADAFERLHLPGGALPQHRLLFRDSPILGANAIALPSGDIIVTDGLVRLARHDDEVLGVLLHESGHVSGRHGLRKMIQGSFVAGVLAWYVGDTTALVAAAPTLLLQAKYSRDFEAQADAYAAVALRENNLSPQRLADILERLEAAQPVMDGQARAFNYLSTHPATADRLRRLRNP